MVKNGKTKITATNEAALPAVAWTNKWYENKLFKSFDRLKAAGKYGLTD